MAKLRVRSGDIVVVAFLFAISIGIIFLSYSFVKQKGEKAVILVEGKREAVLRLDQPARISVEGPLGETIIVVDERGVSVLSSPCPRHYCMELGPVQMSGQSIVCAPNHVSIRITGGSGPALDGVTG